MSTACDGLRIVELSSGMAGDIAGMTLADNGAEVIKIEPPAGSPLRADPGFLVWNRGKKSVVLDLSTPADLQRLLDLIARADAFVNDLPPGAADRLGLGADALAALNPGLVAVDISGFGDRGPLRDLPAYEPLLAAKTGRMASTKGWRPGPVYTGAPIASYGAGMLAVQSLLAALHARRDTGKGQRIHASMLQSLVAYDMTGFGAHMAAAQTELVRGVLTLAFMTPKCKDGRYLQMCSRQPHLLRNWFRTMGLESILDEPRYAKMPDVSLPKEEMQGIVDRVQAKMMEKTSEEWLEIHTREDVGSDPFLDPDEYLLCPQMIVNDRVIEIEDPTVGRIKQIGPLVKMSASPSVINQPAPKIGQHTLEILGGLALAKPHPVSHPATSAKRRYPLEGITVIDNAFFYAAPYSATLLAELGARVIKIEPPTGDPTRRNWTTPYLKGMQGKESVILDLKTQEGKEALYKIVAHADIFLHNFRPGVPDDLKIDYATLRTYKPDLIYIYGSCYGSNGPWKQRPGFHSTPSAIGGSGIVDAGLGNPPRDYVFPDPAGALGAATAMMLGLHHRDRTGEGQYLETTMISSGAYLLSGWSLQYPGKPPLLRPDKGQHGLHALHRLYEAKEGWLFLMCPEPAQWVSLAKSLGLDSLVSDPRFATPEGRLQNDQALAEAIGAALRSRGADAWETALLAAGVPAVRADGIDHHTFMVDDPNARALGLAMEDQLPDGTRFWRAAPCYRFSDYETRTSSAQPIGSATANILREFGYTDAQIKDLDAKGVTRLAGQPVKS